MTRGVQGCVVDIPPPPPRAPARQGVIERYPVRARRGIRWGYHPPGAPLPVHEQQETHHQFSQPQQVIVHLLVGSAIHCTAGWFFTRLACTLLEIKGF